MPEGHDLFAANEPAMGQCAPTSLVVQDYFGGEIVSTVVSASNVPEITSTHFYNVIDSEIVDFTKVQFRKNAMFSESQDKIEGFKSIREYLLFHAPTKQRYELLKSRVAKLIDD
jgi:hypothetical protein